MPRQAITRLRKGTLEKLCTGGCYGFYPETEFPLKIEVKANGELKRYSWCNKCKRKKKHEAYLLSIGETLAEAELIAEYRPDVPWHGTGPRIITGVFGG